MHVTELVIVSKARPHASAGDKGELRVRRDAARHWTRAQRRAGTPTQRIGHVAIPNVGDLVLIGFVHGDIQNPVIVGRLHNNVDRPPVARTRNASMCAPTTEKSGVRRAHFRISERQQGDARRRQSSCWKWARRKLTIKNGGDIELESAANVNDQGGRRHEAGGAAASSSSRPAPASAFEAQTSAKLRGPLGIRQGADERGGAGRRSASLKATARRHRR
mgnify:CR=1 FL=1